MYFLPHFPLHVNVIALFGLTLILGLIGGELAKRSYFFPKISGYIAVGFLVGPHALNIVTPSLLNGARIFVDISLGLILFELGRHLDFRWLYHDRGILYMAILESFLTFSLVITLFLLFHFPWIHAALAATIAIATSPAVVMMVAEELQSKGPVTRRTLILTSLNNLFALLIFTLLLPMAQTHLSVFVITEIIYRFMGSIILGLSIFGITLMFAHFVGKKKANQFVLLVGCVMLAIGLSIILKLSSMLTLFIFGVAARNFNYKYLLMEINFGWLANIFIILLFVITGIHLQIKALWEATFIIIAFLFVRTLAKSAGIWSFAKFSQLTSKQAWALCFALTPMAGLVVGMSNAILNFNPELSYKLTTVIATAVAVLNILGPIAVQLAFMKSDEAATKI